MNAKEIFEIIKESSEIVAAIIALGALIYTARTLGLSRRTARAQFWLTLREQFARHDNVHRKLRPGGSWAGQSGAPATAEEWAELEAYMGLFEHCEAMLSQGLIDTETFRSIYRYRFINILANPVIVRKKLVERRKGWISFIDLVYRLGLEVPAGPVKPDERRSASASSN